MPKTSSEINPAGIRLTRDPDTPLYQQLYQQFREMILQQRLRPNDRLPASRNLSKELGVSRVIVNQAYEQLIMEGYLVGKTGAGTFVAAVLPDRLLQPAIHHPTPASQSPPPPIRKTGRPGSAPKPARSTASVYTGVPFQNGMPALDQFPYKIWQQVAARALKDLKVQSLGYGDIYGHPDLRRAIASYLRVARAVNCEPDQVIVVTGSQQGLNLIARTLLSPGDKVWMEDPGYPGARSSFSQAGAHICDIPVLADGLDIGYAIEKCGEAKMAYVTPSHQFPMGYTLSHEKRLQLLDYAGRQDMWILEDDYDSEFRYEGNPLASVQGLDNRGRVIYTGTFSKVLFPALRLAYIVVPSTDLLERFEKIKANSDRQSPILDQLIVSRFMEEGYFLRHIRKMRLLYAERQATLVKLLQQQDGDFFHLTVEPSGMHIRCRLPDNIDLAKFREAARQTGMILSVINDYSHHSIPPTIALGFTAFTPYRMKMGVAQLTACVKLALPEGPKWS